MTVKAMPARDVPTLTTKDGELEALTGPLTVRVETTAGLVDSVVVPRVRFDEIEELLEDRAAEAAYRRTRGEESFPREVADSLMDGDSPVRVFRDYRGMKAARLAAAVGISRSYLSEIENGAKPGSARVLRRIADALGVDLDHLA
ncbi:MAG: helix-turn-helix domain-containing protein [Rhodospirillales bacterium]